MSQLARTAKTAVNLDFSLLVVITRTPEVSYSSIVKLLGRSKVTGTSSILPTCHVSTPKCKVVLRIDSHSACFSTCSLNSIEYDERVRFEVVAGVSDIAKFI